MDLVKIFNDLHDGLELVSLLKDRGQDCKILGAPDYKLRFH